jgi:hypothetical protein
MAKLDRFTRARVSTRDLDLDHLPLTLKLIDRRLPGAFMVVFSLLWGGLPGVILLSQWRDLGLMALPMLLFPVIGLAIFGFGLHWFFRRKTITIGDELVQCEERSLRGGRESWVQAVSGYRGVLYQITRIQHGKSTYTAYAVRLEHLDGDRSIPLYLSTDPEEARRQWERASRRFRLPALEETAEGEIRRDVEDLDKSVAELAVEGKLEIDFEARPPPPGLAATYEGDALLVTRTGPVNNLFVMGLVAAFPWVFIVIGWREGGLAYLFLALGLLFELAILAAIVWDTVTRQRLRVTADQVVKCWVAAWGQGRGTRLAAAGIESVNIGKTGSGAGTRLVIASDDDILHFGARLSDEALEWLRQAVLGQLAGEARSET